MYKMDNLGNIETTLNDIVCFKLSVKNKKINARDKVYFILRDDNSVVFSKELTFKQHFFYLEINNNELQNISEGCYEYDIVFDLYDIGKVTTHKNKKFIIEGGLYV